MMREQYRKKRSRTIWNIDIERVMKSRQVKCYRSNKQKEKMKKAIG